MTVGNKRFCFDNSAKEIEMKEIPCQNCGRKVAVRVPFYGCIFCEECIKGESYESADAPEFKEDWEDR